jgi:lysophospholipase L1-like esterase
MKSEMDMSLAFVGDSDIDYWPSEVLPTLDGAVPVAAVSGHSGASLSETLPHLRKVLENHGSIQKLMIVACAGENDIGDGISLDNSLIALRQFLDAIFSNDEKVPSFKHHLIFLGPKFEPWLEDDPSYKKAYSKMSRAFSRCCEKHENADQIQFIDCLTMFCGDTATIPGAVLAGRAKADYKYFAADKLHLSIHGYTVWQQVVQERITEIIS